MSSEVDLIKKLLTSNPDLKPKIEINSICESTRFRGDMGFDSLAMASLFYELQEIYSHIEESEMIKWETVSDCIKTLRQS